MTVNVLPSPTWRWMKLNDQQVEITAPVSEGSFRLTLPEGISRTETDYTEIKDIPGGMGYDMDTFAMHAGVPVTKFTAAKGQRTALPVVIDLDYQEGCSSLNLYELSAEEDSEMTVIMFFTAEEAAAGQAIVQTKIRAEKNARVRLVQAEKLGRDFRFYNDIGTRVSDGAAFEQISLVLRGGKTWQGSRTDLAGTGSTLRTDIGYLLKGDETLDMNYIANHIGRKSQCEINANGVLRDRAGKLFRGTIDLRKGAKGAVGNEMEDVLLMDDHVVNQTIPVILCDEEDVEGNHGATIGRLDESLLFYLESRGMDRSAVYEMMAAARIDAVISRIPDAAARERLYQRQTI